MIVCISLILWLVYPTIHKKMVLLTNKGTLVMVLLSPDPRLYHKYCVETLGSDKETYLMRKPEAGLGNTE